MRKHFFIPRYDTDNNIPTRNELSEDDDGYNAFSNHPTDKKKMVTRHVSWERSSIA